MSDLTKSRITVAQVTQVIIYVITIMLAYSALDKRITAVEVKYDMLAADVAEIKADIKTLLRRTQ